MNRPTDFVVFAHQNGLQMTAKGMLEKAPRPFDLLEFRMSPFKELVQLPKAGVGFVRSFNGSSGTEGYLVGCLIAALDSVGREGMLGAAVPHDGDRPDARSILHYLDQSQVLLMEATEYRFGDGQRRLEAGIGFLPGMDISPGSQRKDGSRTLLPRKGQQVTFIQDNEHLDSGLLGDILSLQIDLFPAFSDIILAPYGAHVDGQVISRDLLRDLENEANERRYAQEQQLRREREQREEEQRLERERLEQERLERERVEWEERERREAERRSRQSRPAILSAPGHAGNQAVSYASSAHQTANEGDRITALERRVAILETLLNTRQRNPAPHASAAQAPHSYSNAEPSRRLSTYDQSHDPLEEAEAAGRRELPNNPILLIGGIAAFLLLGIIAYFYGVMESKNNGIPGASSVQVIPSSQRPAEPVDQSAAPYGPLYQPSYAEQAQPAQYASLCGEIDEGLSQLSTSSQTRSDVLDQWYTCSVEPKRYDELSTGNPCDQFEDRHIVAMNDMVIANQRAGYGGGTNTPDGIKALCAQNGYDLH